MRKIVRHIFADSVCLSPQSCSSASSSESVVQSPPVVLYDRLNFPEAPRWRDGRLYFVNMASEVGSGGPGGSGRVESLSLSGEHRVEANLAPITAKNPSGLGWLPDGRMLIVSTGTFELLSLAPGTGRLEKYADLSSHSVNGKGLLNDMTVSREGHAYVDLYTAGKLCKIICVPPGGGEGTEVATGLGSPNGLVLTPDGLKLIVAETRNARLTVFDRDPLTGLLSGQRIWAEVPGLVPDGCCLDSEGCMWVASPSDKQTRFARIAEGGRVLETIKPVEGSKMNCIACCLGGPDRRTLFLLESLHFPGEEAFQNPNTACIRTVKLSVGAASDPRDPKYCAGYR